MGDRRIHFAAKMAVVCLCWALAWTPTWAQKDVADIPHQDLRAGADKDKRYFLIVAGDRLQVPPGGFGLVVVLPGGDGGPDFLPFVKRIYKHALPKGYLVAQLVAVKWTPEQPIVWPTEGVKVAKQRFSTEQFVDAVVKDVAGKFPLSDRIFSLAWSSGGPAAYAASLHETKPVTGSFIAMSVFKPKQLPPLAQAKAHAYFLYHSPQDRVCPFGMAKAADQALTAQGAKVKLLEYAGGHGWRGAVYPRIREGVQWLEKNRALYLRPGVGLGPVRFGMSGEEVIARFGKPEQLEAKVGLGYQPSRGFAVLVSGRRGVVSISCFSSWYAKVGFPVAGFAGVTTEGIAMGASREEIIKAYGKPSSETKGPQTTLAYARLGITFGLRDDQVITISISKGL